MRINSNYFTPCSIHSFFVPHVIWSMDKEWADQEPLVSGVFIKGVVFILKCHMYDSRQAS